MLDNVVTPLNFTVNLNSLKEYYTKLVTNYSRYCWSWEKNGNEITQEWRARIMQDKGTMLPYGWAIQSNLVDISIPCPPYNISIHPQCEYRNTELAFGIIERLQTLMPYTYRWSLVVQPPEGRVTRHTDQEDEYTVHIPIYESTGAIFRFWNNDTYSDINLTANGSAYLMNTLIEHETMNTGNENRIGLVFRFHRSKLSNVLSITGEIK